MENVPPMEQASSVASFEEVESVQLKGDTTKMSKCKSCNFVTTNDSFNMWKHWKYACPHKLFFKYSYPVDDTNGCSALAVMCLVCGNKFNQSTIGFMAIHRKQCGNFQPDDTNGNRTNPSSLELPLQIELEPCLEPIEIVDENSRNDIIIGPLTSPYQIQSKVVDNQKRLTPIKIRLSKERYTEYSSECQVCKNFFVTDAANQLKTCNKCRDDRTALSEENVFISVQTVRNNETVESVTDQSTKAPLQNENQRCFICNNSVGDGFVDLFATTTAHSCKNIFDYVWKFLGGKPSVRNDKTDTSCLKQEVVCRECFDMINEYDAARITAKKYKKHLRKKLITTENYFKRTHQINDVAVAVNDGNYVIDLSDDDDDDE